MIEPTVNTKAAIAGLAGLKGKGGMKGGLFARFLAAFQAQMQKSGKMPAASAVPAIGPASIIGAAGKKAAAEDGAATVIRSASAEPSGRSRKAVESGLGKLMLSGSEALLSRNDLKEQLLAAIDGENGSQSGEASKEHLLVGPGEVFAGKADHVTPHKEAVFSAQERVKGLSEKHSSDPFKGAMDRSGEKPVDSRVIGAFLAGRPAFEKSIVSEGESEGIKTNHSGDGFPSGTEKAVTAASEMKSLRSSLTGLSSAAEKSAMPAGQEAAIALKSVADVSVTKASDEMPHETAKSLQGGNVSTFNQLAAGVLPDEQTVRGQTLRVQVQEDVTRNSHNTAGIQSEQVELPVKAAVQDRVKTVTQSQQVQPNQPQAGGLEKVVVHGSESGSGTSQQDMGAGNQQAEALLTDSLKSDPKGSRGTDFSAHMNYKTAQTHKPADVMLEIARSAKDGAMKLELHLEPAHLGKVHVTLQSDVGKQLQVHFTVDQALSRQVLEQHLPQLRQALAQQGLDLGHFSMNMHSQGGQGDSSGAGHSPFSEFSSLNGVPGEEQDGSSVQFGINTAGNGRISILA